MAAARPATGLLKIALMMSIAACTSVTTPTQGGVSCTVTPPVYHPDRLQLLSPCKEVRGTVLAVIHEPDGDYHIWLAPDQGYEGLLNKANHYAGRPALVLEVVPACSSQPADSESARACPVSAIKPPLPGQHIVATGPWVFDSAHGWNELHPVASLA